MKKLAAEHLIADGLMAIIIVAGGSFGAASCLREKVGTGSGAWATLQMMVAHPLPGGVQLGADAHCSSFDPDSCKCILQVYGPNRAGPRAVT